MKNLILVIGLLITVLSSCIIIPNNDTEWTYPEIKGYLMDSITNKSINNAIVFEKYYGDTIRTDSFGFFNFKAQKEYIRFEFIAMDPPRDYIDLRFEKEGYLPKELSLHYKKVDYDRIKCDTIDLKQIKLIKNTP
jgi:hypothetical protein